MSARPRTPLSIPQTPQAAAVLIDKLSKKVVEMTIVVHKLFKRCHEKEYEASYIKGQCSTCFKQHDEKLTTKIQWLEKELDARISLSSKDGEKSTQILQLEQKCSELKIQCDDLNKVASLKEDMLIHLQKENAALEKKIADVKNSTNYTVPETSTDDGIVNNLKSHNEELQLQLESFQRDHTDCAATMASMTDEQNAMRNRLSIVESGLQQQIEILNQTLKGMKVTLNAEKKEKNDMENEIVSLNSKLKASNKEKEVLSSKLKNSNQKLASSQPDKVQSRTNPLSYSVHTRDAEIARLWALVQSLRLELFNRENNYNRMFTDKQPIYVQLKQGYSSRNLTGTEKPGRRRSPSQLNTRPTLPYLQENRTLNGVPDNQDSHKISALTGHCVTPGWEGL